jgi:hypothetical protein
MIDEAALIQMPEEDREFALKYLTSVKLREQRKGSCLLELR